MYMVLHAGLHILLSMFLIFSCLWACVNFDMAFDTILLKTTCWCFSWSHAAGHENLTQNSPTDVWPWWPSSECYWADVLNHVWMISIESTIVLWVYVCSDSVLMWLIFSDPNILRSETFCVTKVLPGRPHWLCLGWLGLVHWLPTSCFREWAWSCLAQDSFGPLY